MLVRPGGGRDGAVELRGPWGTFHNSWDREAWLWEIGPGDQVDFMSDSLPLHREDGEIKVERMKLKTKTY